MSDVLQRKSPIVSQPLIHAGVRMCPSVCGSSDSI